MDVPPGSVAGAEAAHPDPPRRDAGHRVSGGVDLDGLNLNVATSNEGPDGQ